MTTTEEKPPLPDQETMRKAWVSALRSGQYKQNTCVLCRVKNGSRAYCCLGVACDVAKRAGFPVSEGMGDEGQVTYVTYDGKASTCPALVVRVFGLRNDIGTFVSVGGERNSLVEVNDVHNLTFEQIADIIESKPEGLFV